MELNRKCKLEFEKFYYKKYCKSEIKFKDLLPHHKEDVFGWFYKLPINMQYGIMLEYFDSVHLYCSISVDEAPKRGYYGVELRINGDWKNDYLNRNDAVLGAIMYLDSMRNKALEKNKKT